MIHGQLIVGYSILMCIKIEPAGVGLFLQLEKIKTEKSLQEELEKLELLN